MWRRNNSLNLLNFKINFLPFIKALEGDVSDKHIEFESKNLSKVELTIIKQALIFKICTTIESDTIWFR